MYAIHNNVENKSIYKKFSNDNKIDNKMTQSDINKLRNISNFYLSVRHTIFKTDNRDIIKALIYNINLATELLEDTMFDCWQTVNIGENFIFHFSHGVISSCNFEVSFNLIDQIIKDIE